MKTRSQAHRQVFWVTEGAFLLCFFSLQEYSKFLNTGWFTHDASHIWGEFDPHVPSLSVIVKAIC